MNEDPAQPSSFDPDMEGGLGGTVLRGAGIAAAGHVLSQVLTLAAYLALARLISPADFGQFAAASILIAAGSLFTESGMLAALIHRRDRLEEAASTAFVATARAGIGFALLALALSPVVGSFFGSDRITTLSAAVSGILFVRALPVVPSALMQRRFSILRRAVAEPLAVLAFGVSATIAAVHDLGPWALVIGYYASAATDAIASWALVRWRPKFGKASYGMWRELVAYGRHVLTGTAILHLSDLVPTALLGRYVSAGALGQYRYANR
ncbi:MAG: hypothetical protein QOE53_2863, partial [Pseudonocardiales bacterium]|nr:hypothetical protein [Pseudonocardiales bacterium]